MQKPSVEQIFQRFELSYFRGLATFGALSDQAIELLVSGGEIWQLAAGERVERFGEAAEDFQVVLQGKTAFYKRGDNCEVLTRYFCAGDQLGFDLMIGMIPHNGTDVAVEESLILNISKTLFYRMHEELPADFGLLMINLARELSREIEILEDVIVSGAPSEVEVG